MQLTAESKKKIFKKFGGSEQNTGDAASQVALFTERINHLTQHLKSNRKDFGTQQALIKLVGKRRSLLNYLHKTDIEHYRSLISQLKIRR